MPQIDRYNLAGKGSGESDVGRCNALVRPFYGSVVLQTDPFLPDSAAQIGSLSREDTGVTMPSLGLYGVKGLRRRKLRFYSKRRGLGSRELV